VLSAAFIAQAAPQMAPPPPSTQPPAQQAAPVEPAPPPSEPGPVTGPAKNAGTADAQADIETGLKAFRARRLRAARAAFENAEAADPESAAAAFYLGYTLYKLGEPSRRMNPDKQRARELFAKAFRLDPTFQPAFGRK
jgi:tetratricopeptide (TPR) repeat protein